MFIIAIPDVIGHRGYAGEYPENTFISFQESVKAGATALEGGRWPSPQWGINQVLKSLINTFVNK